MPRIEDQNAGGFEISHVPRHEAQTVPPRRGGEEPVHRLHDSARSLCGGRKIPPDAAGFEIDRKETVGVMVFQRAEPSGQLALPPAIGQQGNALGDFTDGDDTDEQVLVFQIVDGLTHSGISPGMAEFRQHAGIK